MHLDSTCLLFCRCLSFLPQIGDRNGELTARMNVEQLMEALGVNESDLSPSSSEFEMQGDMKRTYHAFIRDIMCSLVS